MRESVYDVAYVSDGRWRYASHSEFGVPQTRKAAEIDSYTLCDGERIWTVSPDMVVAEWAGPPTIPLDQLLDPSWLLARHVIAVEGEETVAGRPGIRVAAIPRRPRSTYPSLSAAGSSVVDMRIGVRAVVDQEYGFLLAYEQSVEGRPTIWRGFSSITIDPGADCGSFPALALPAGVPMRDQTVAGWNRRANLAIRVTSAASLAVRALRKRPVQPAARR